jgi:hypothetical protein
MGYLDSLTSGREVACPVPDESAVASAGLFRHWFAAILILAVFAFCVPTIPSADMWWHLSTGRYVLETHSIPHADPFSATISGKPWTVHEWLSGVVFYFEYSRLGPAGLLLLTGFVLTLAFWLAYHRSEAPCLPEFSR